MAETALPPHHPGLEGVDLEGLKHKCPAFQTGCPYAKVDQVESLAINSAELSKCPAFEKGCPFSNKSKDEIATLLATIPKEHPTLNMNEFPPCDDGIALFNVLNQFLKVTELETVFNANNVPNLQEEPILEDPQLAQAMRDGTKVVHRAAETSVFTRRFLKGEITREEYGRYILSLYFVYQKMEALLEQHKSHSSVQLIHFPAELNREAALLDDLDYFYGKDRARALVQDKSNITPAVRSYLTAMDEACAKHPALLIAHSYSRYLGDLSGGQLLAKRLKQAVMGLKPGSAEWDTTVGLAFYHFDQLGNQAEFKDFYRHRLNSANVNATTREWIVAEAVRSFELNIAVFDEIQHLSETNCLPPMPNVNKRVQTQQQTITNPDGSKTIRTITTTTTTTATNGSEKHQQRKQQRRRPTPADSNITCWIMGTTLVVTAISVGLHVYKRYYVKE